MPPSVFVSPGATATRFLRVHRRTTASLPFPERETLTSVADIAIDAMNKAKRGLADVQQRLEALTLTTAIATKYVDKEEQLDQLISSVNKIDWELHYLRVLMVALRSHELISGNQKLAQAGISSLADLVRLAKQQQQSSERLLGFEDEDSPLSPQSPDSSQISFDGPVDSVYTFNSENRAVLLITANALDTLSCALDEVLKTKSSKFVRALNKKLLQRFLRRFDMLELMTLQGVKLAENRWCYLQHQLTSWHQKGLSTQTETPRLLFPYSDGLDLRLMQEFKSLDPTPFLEELGSHISPSCAWVLSTVAAGTAAHRATFSLKLQNDYLRQIALGVLLPKYLLDSRNSGRFVAKYFTDALHNKFEMRDVIYLWDLIDRGFTRLGFYFILPPIACSKAVKVQGRLLEEEGQDAELQEETQPVAQSEPETSPLVIDEIELKENQPQHHHNDIHDVIVVTEGMKPSSMHMNEHRTVVLIPGTTFEGNLTNEEFWRQHKNFKRMVRETTDHTGQLADINIKIISAKPVDLPEARDGFLILDSVSRVAAQVAKPLLVSAEPSSCSYDDVIIFHCHGGGFVGMSAYSHENYLRQWAQELPGVVIVSSNYRLAPDVVHPCLVSDVYEAYQWTVQNASRLLGGKPLRKIIVAGDSAGGNLANALTVRCIAEKVRVPDACVFTYPASFCTRMPCPARVQASIDPLVNSAFLLLCLSAFIDDKEHDGRRDPYISPAIASDEIYAQFPPTYVNVGVMDPIGEDGIFVAKKIYKHNGGRVALDVYDTFSHGYLSFNGVSVDGDLANRNIVSWVRAIMEGEEDGNEKA